MMLLTKQHLTEILSQPLPGVAAHVKMATESRAAELQKKSNDPSKARKSAVMMLFFEENDALKMVMIRRSEYVGIHAGQMAFPGGRYEEEDRDVQTTAFREIGEEIGIPPEKIELIGRLTDIYVPVSNFLISIFVGYLPERPVYHKDDREVAEIIEIPFSDFLQPDVIKHRDFFVNGRKVSSNAPYFAVTNADVWGASAMVINELLELLPPLNEKIRTS